MKRLIWTLLSAFTNIKKSVKEKKSNKDKKVLLLFRPSFNVNLKFTFLNKMINFTLSSLDLIILNT